MNKFGVIFLLGLSVLIAVADRAPMHLEQRLGVSSLSEDFNILYQGIVDKSIEAPYVYRIGVPHLINAFTSILPLKPVDVAFGMNIVFVFVALLCLYFFSREFLSAFHAYLSTLIFSFYIVLIQAMMPGIILVETQDILNVVFFNALLFFLYRKYWGLFGIGLTLSILNRETTLVLLLPAMYLLWKQRYYVHGVIICLGSIGMYVLLRWLVNSQEVGWFKMDKVAYNVPGINMDNLVFVLKSNLYVLLLIFPFIYLARIDWREAPIFHKLLLLTSMALVAINYIFGTIIELRLFLPLIAMLLPLAFKNLKQKLSLEQ